MSCPKKRKKRKKREEKKPCYFPCEKKKHHRSKMETQHPWRPRLSFKNATIVMTVLNIITVLFLLKGFLSSPSTRNNKLAPDSFNSVELSYIKESEEMRLALQPWKLIKRIKEIEQEAYAEPETVEHKDMKQTAAVDLSKRLQDIRSVNDVSSFKALEEWRKRKMERARQRAVGKNGRGNSQA
uniref:Transmembrane protein n=1 Tax=Populus davidiana TaxID=266767 RepID=A0A6M2F789_9ROSI